jgi:hypothetical protein
VGREITLRLPIAERNVATLVATARSTPRNVDGQPVSEVDGRPVTYDGFAEPTLTQTSAIP